MGLEGVEAPEGRKGSTTPAALAVGHMALSGLSASQASARLRSLSCRNSALCVQFHNSLSLQFGVLSCWNVSIAAATMCLLCMGTAVYPQFLQILNLRFSIFSCWNVSLAAVTLRLLCVWVCVCVCGLSNS